MKIQATLILALAVSLLASGAASGGAIDDIKIEVSHDPCEGEGGSDSNSNSNSNYIVYASNLNAAQVIDVIFKYDSSPAQQHFIIFDADLNPSTDRFPKSAARRLVSREKTKIGCTYTYRAAPRGSALLRVPIVISKQGASYVDASGPATPPAVARAFAAFLLQGTNGECGAGSKPPGLLYLTNLHPFAQLSVALNLLDDRGNRMRALTHTLPPFGAIKVGCSNGPSKPGPIVAAVLEVPEGFAATVASEATPKTRPPALAHQDSQSIEAAALVPLPLGAILRTQNVCAGSLPSGWVKINDAWNPTVCGKPATVNYNVWTIQQLSEDPIGVVVQACTGDVPAGWAVVGTSWNPTLCGHPAGNQRNVMAIKRLN
jgi:hypothetical protein